MNGVGMFSAAVLGLLAGWLARLALGRRLSLFACLIAGWLGSFVGDFLVRSLHIVIRPGALSSLIISTVGATLLVGLFGLARGDQRKRT